MKAISIKQPWARLICTPHIFSMSINRGIKDIENRTWPVPKKYIGERVLIHASSDQKLDKTACNLIYSKDQLDYLSTIYTEIELCSQLGPFGCIIGSIELIGCKINHKSIWADKTGIFEKPIYNWELANPILFPEPIPAKGKLSIWDFPEIQAEVEKETGKLFCNCQLHIDERKQVMSLGNEFRCLYCGGIWYK